jgi:AcrR family transcriptional regulator
MALATVRRKGAEGSKTRAQLLHAAAQILRDEGAGAVTARRLAEQVGLGRHIVHYYFGTIDELFVALMREEGQRTEDWLKEATETGDALSLLWENSWQSASIIQELTILAMRHSSIGAEYKIYTERFRNTIAGILTIYAQARGIVLPGSAAATAMMVQSVACTMALEFSLDIEMGHQEAKAALTEWLRNTLEPRTYLSSSLSLLPDQGICDKM